MAHKAYVRTQPLPSIANDYTPPKKQFQARFLESLKCNTMLQNMRKTTALQQLALVTVAQKQLESVAFYSGCCAI
jgi:Rod binding domain-containing protein